MTPAPLKAPLPACAGPDALATCSHPGWHAAPGRASRRIAAWAPGSGPEPDPTRTHGCRINLIIYKIIIIIILLLVY